MVQAVETLALDRASVRRIDHDGHLHVEVTPISKANVCGYYGREIPDSQRLGLDDNRMYQLLRDPAELARGAASFNGKPLLLLHKVLAADSHPHKQVVGSVSNARFEPPYLKSSLVVWDGAAIAGIDSQQNSQLSSAYRYDADMTPGVYNGVRYDGVMRNLKANHVALVTTGRAGSDVVVQDAMPRSNKFKDHRMQKFMACDAWEEGAHKRDGGRFSSGGGAPAAAKPMGKGATKKASIAAKFNEQYARHSSPEAVAKATQSKPKASFEYKGSTDGGHQVHDTSTGDTHSVSYRPDGGVRSHFITSKMTPSGSLGSSVGQRRTLTPAQSTGKHAHIHATIASQQPKKEPKK